MVTLFDLLSHQLLGFSTKSFHKLSPKYFRSRNDFKNNITNDDAPLNRSKQIMQKTRIRILEFENSNMKWMSN